MLKNGNMPDKGLWQDLVTAVGVARNTMRPLTWATGDPLRQAIRAGAMNTGRMEATSPSLGNKKLSLVSAKGAKRSDKRAHESREAQG